MEYGLLVRWLVVLLALGLAGLPVAARLFRRFPDRGASLALPLSLALVGVVAYWVGHLSLSLGLAVGLLVLLGASLLSLRGLDRDAIDLRRALAPTLVFALAFSFVVAFRAVDPAVHPGGGEKFLDFGLLKSLLRTSRLPPADFWFAGEPVQYYYGGHLLTALLSKLTLTEARYAYNLALAGFFAMLVTAAYGLAGTIADDNGYSPRTAGALAAFFVGIASNLETPARALLWALPDTFSGALASVLDVELDGLAASPAAFSYWEASRVIPGTVNEFPLFAWLNGDLHAHMMSTPFLLLVAALWFAYYRTPAGSLTRRRVLVFVTVPPVVGLLAVVNTWSVPTAAGVGWLALTFADADPATLLSRTIGTRFSATERSRLREEAVRTASALAVAAVVLVLGVGWSLPFWLGSASGRALDVFPDRSAVGPLLLVYGAFLLVFVPYLLARTRGLDTRTRRLVLGTVLVSFVLAGLADAAALAVFVPLLLVGWLALSNRRGAGRRPGDRSGPSETPGRFATESDGGTVEAGTPNPVVPVGFETLLVVAGAGLVLLVEFVYVVENAGPGRFNTVFKTYAQVWVLFGTAIGVMGAWLVDARPDVPTDVTSPARPAVGRVLVALLVLSTSLYGALALSDQFSSESAEAAVEDPTLDALAFVPATHPEETAAIEWLDARSGQPTIVSLPGCWCNDEAFMPYRWVNAPSSLTGVPTVVGWGHEIGYRGEPAYMERVEDVETIYEGSPTERARLLEAYDVRYIYVGPNERAVYGSPDFGSMDGISVAHRSGAVTIYRVDRRELAG